MEEMLDLFTAQGQPAGITIRRGDDAPEGLYWAVVDIWVVNSRGEILIQRRDDSKPNWAGYWCESAGGAVQSGEAPDEAARRETLEEIGLELDFERGGKVFEYVGGHSYKHVYLFCQDADPAALIPQPGEVTEVKFVSPTELLHMVRRDEFVPMGYLSQLMQMLPILISMYRKAD